MLSNADGWNFIKQAFSTVVSAEGSFDVFWEHPRMINYLYDLVLSERNQIVLIEQIYSTGAAKHIRNAAADPNSAESALKEAFKALKGAELNEGAIYSGIGCFVSAVPSLSEAYVSLLKWQSNKNADAATRYIALQLSVQNWDSAKEHCDAAMGKYPEISELYLYRLMANYKLSNEADLIDKDLDLKDDPDFQNAVLHASTKVRQEELFRHQEAQEQKKRKYHEIQEGLTRCRTEQDYLKLEAECKSILSFRNTSELLKKCRDSLQRVRADEKTYVRACEALAAARKYQDLKKWTEAAEAFKSAAGFFSGILSHKDSRKLAAECGNPTAYLKAVGLMERAQSESAFREAAAAFEVAGSFGDSEIRWKQCVEQAENSRKNLIYQKACGKIAEAQKIGFLNWRKYR